MPTQDCGYCELVKCGGKVGQAEYYTTAIRLWCEMVDLQIAFDGSFDNFLTAFNAYVSSFDSFSTAFDSFSTDFDSFATAFNSFVATDFEALAINVAALKAYNANEDLFSASDFLTGGGSELVIDSVSDSEICVYAFSLCLLEDNISTVNPCIFYSEGGSNMYVLGVPFTAPVQLSVDPNSYLFKTELDEGLILESANSDDICYAISYFVNEP